MPGMRMPEVPKYFVGREKEQVEFRKRLADYQNKRTWVIHGTGGVGKSYILQKLQMLCVDEGLPHAYVEFDPSSVSTSVQSLREIVASLWGKDPGKFSQANGKLIKIETLQKGLLQGVLEKLKPVTPRVGLAVDIYTGSVFGSLGASAVEMVSELMARGMSKADAEFYVQAPQRLLKAFKEDFNEFRRHQKQPVVLLFDAYERAESAVDELVRHLVLHLPETFFVIGSRDNVDWKTREDVEPGLRELEVADTPIEDFIAEDSTAYFDERGVTGDELRESILTLTGAFPQLMALACDVVDLSKEIGEEPSAKDFDYETYEHEQVTQFLFGRFLDRLTGEKEYLRDIVLDVGLCRRANREVLETLFGVEPVKADGYLDELKKFSYVIPVDRLGKVIRYHERVRKAVYAWWKDSPKKRETIHRRMHEYHLPGWNERSDPNHLCEALYHHAQFEPKEAMVGWSSIFQAALRRAAVPLCEALIGDLEDYGLTKEDVDGYNWGVIQNSIGIAYGDLPTGDRSDNLWRAINCYEKALWVYTEEEHPPEWATTQNNLGNAYRHLPTGDKTENLQQAIACYEAALRVRTEEAFLDQWAQTQNNLGNAFLDLPTGDLAENLQQAIDYYQPALRVYTEEEHPPEWATTQNNLGAAYFKLPTGDQTENLQQAIDYFEAALRVRTEEAFPIEWAATQNNLGAAHFKLPTGDRTENLQRAIDYFEAALRAWKEDSFPADWAMTKYNLGVAYGQLSVIKEGDEEKRLLEQAVQCFQNALTIYTEESFPNEHKLVLHNLALARQRLADP